MSTAPNPEPTIDQRIADAKAKAISSFAGLMRSILIPLMLLGLLIAFMNNWSIWSFGVVLASLVISLVAISKGATLLLSSHYTHRELLAEKYAR